MTANRRAALALFAAALVGCPAAMSAQEWRIGVDAGRIRSSIAPIASRSARFAAGAGYEDKSTAFRLSGGIPTAADSLRWVSAAGWKRLAVTRHRLTAGVDLSGSVVAFQQRATVPGQPDGGGGLLGPAPRPLPGGSESVDGHAIAGQVLPTVAWQQGHIQLQARAGVSYYDASTGNGARDRMVDLAELQLVFTPTSTMAVGPVLRHLAPRGDSAATFAGVSLLAASGPLTVWSSVGAWAGGTMSGSERSAWSAAGDLRLAPRVSLTASVRHDGLDPLYRTPAQTSWSLGAALVLGRPATAPAAPMVTRTVNGTATIRVDAALFPSPPQVAGDFNGWNPAPMTRVGRHWTYSVAAAPGVDNYAFVDESGTWYVPEGVPGRKDDGFGGHVAVLVVR